MLFHIFFICRLHCLAQICISVNLPFSKTCDKRRPDVCTVLICYICSHGEVIIIRRSREQRKRRSEQEIVDTIICIKPAYLADDRERRIINHHTPGRIIMVFIISTRPERPHYLSALEPVVFNRPVSDCCIHALRCIAVVCR